MLFVFEALKGLLKLKTISIDGPVFRLHTKFTVLILLAFCLLLTLRQYFGDPIHCIQRDVTRLKALETFCWIHATFILPEAWNSTVGQEVPHPGIDKHTPGTIKVYHGYYQWVTFVLLLQGILFYFPKYLWKCWEKGLIKDLTLDLHDPVLPEESARKSIKLLSHSLTIHWGCNNSYFHSFIFCEMLTLVNVVGQMFLLDKFLNGAFTTFGVKVLAWSSWDQEYRTDPLVEAFPRMTKCQYSEYGSSGDPQKYDALCLLPLNIMNEKIFIFLWFWMVFLCGLSILNLLFRILLVGMPILRFCLLTSRAPHINKGALDKLLFSSKVSDWFVLYLLVKNIDSGHFRSVIGQLAAKMEQNGHLSLPSTSYMDNGKIANV